MKSRGISIAAAAALVAASLAGAAPGLAVEGAVPPRDGRAFVPGEVLVEFRGGDGERLVELPGEVGVREAAAALREAPGVRYAVPNYIARAAFVPNDPGTSGVKRGWQEDQWNFLDGPGGVNAVEAWDILRDAGRDGGRRESGKRGPVLAVVDTGVAYRDKGTRFRRSPDLPKKGFVEGKDLVAGDPLALDENGHGTHVASTILEQVNNGEAVTGLAYGVRVMPVRVLDEAGSGTAKEVADGIRWAAEHGAKVINLSLEFGVGEVNSCADVPSVCKAIRQALKSEILVVAAAGNQGRARVAYPAAADDPSDGQGVSRFGPVVGVGASTIRGCLTDFSDYGKGLDIVAPRGGDDRGKAGPQCDPLGPGPPIVQLTLRTGPAAHDDFTKFGYPRYDGTSMAAPHVSATAALIISSRVARDELGHKPSPAELLDWISARARTKVDGAPLEKSFYGAGLLDAAAALTS
jgi:serine protease